jgi:hypothetical protein
MIKINCDGGQIGRFWWENSRENGIFYGGHRQPQTTLRPGRCGWDEAWPDFNAWPVSPWGKGDAQDDYWRDFAAFEPWFDHQMEARGLDEQDLTITERIELYALLVHVFQLGIQAGKNPWKWANQLANQPTEEQP